MDKKYRPYLAELVGTFALVFLGAGTACASRLAEGQSPPQSYLVAVALAEGFALPAGPSATMNVSGGFLNPAVTLTLWVFKRLDGVRALWLIAAQFMGALLAGLCLRVIFQDETAFRPATPHLNLAAFGGGEVTLPVLLSGIGIELA